MISTKCYSHVNSNEYDEVWVIVRLWSEPVSDPRMRHVPELSPSPELLRIYLDLRDNGEWDYEAFTTVYLPRFLKEFSENAAVTEALLDELCEKDRAGKNICLCCFCTDETICHRSIVAGFLQKRGIEVKTETGQDYTGLIR